MKPICATVLFSVGMVTSHLQASSLELNVPPLTYKEAVPKPQWTPDQRPLPRVDLPFKKLPRLRVTGETKYQLHIIPPGDDVDYKLLVIPADPTIDPEMLIDPSSNRRLSK